jgi:hypothetical protein
VSEPGTTLESLVLILFSFFFFLQRVPLQIVLSLIHLDVFLIYILDLFRVAIFDVLDLFKVEDGFAYLDPVRCEHKVYLFAVFAGQIPVLNHAPELILEHEVIPVDHMVEVGVKTLR